MVIKLLGRQRNIKAIEPYLSQSFKSLKKRAYLESSYHCKVMIPRWTGQSYGIRWRSEMWVTDETKVTDGRTDGTYIAGVKDSASAYVLCPRLSEQLCLSIWKGIGSAERDFRSISRWELERSAERRNDGI